MGKRRKAWMEDDDSSEGDDDGPPDDDDDERNWDPDDPDVAAERELFRNPYQRGANSKRRRAAAKEDALYGIWADGETTAATDRQGRYSNVSKAPTFVSAGDKDSTAPPPLDNLATRLPIEPAAQDEQDLQMDTGESDESGSQEEEEDDEQLAPVPGLAKEPSPPRPPEPDQSSLGFAPRGIGARAGIGGGSRPGLGGAPGATAGLGGIGARPSVAQMMREQFTSTSAPAESPATTTATPTATDSAPASSREATPVTTAEGATGEEPKRPRMSFLPQQQQQQKKPLGKLSKQEQVHFAKLSKSGSKGLKMLEKMGWKSGTGLGAEGQGIVTPVGEGQKVRERGKGISAGERSAAAIAEAARMRGEDPDEIEKRERQARKAEKAKVKREAWTQPKKAPKVKKEYKSYEDIIAESGVDGAASQQEAGVGLLVDISGNALPTQTLSGLPGVGSADTSNLPELRHNLNLICSTTAATLSSLAREGKAIEERRQYIAKEEERVRQVVTSQEEAISRLTGISELVKRIKEKETEVNDLLVGISAEEAGPKALFDPFMDLFDELFGIYGQEYETLRLDEAVVAAVAPIFRRLLQAWDPLRQPTHVLPEIKRLRRHFLIDKDLPPKVQSTDLDVFGNSQTARPTTATAAASKQMTPYETMMWTLWLPKVRSSINNVWDATDSVPAVALFVSWSPVLPRFIRDNVLDQLVIPKVSKAISEWSSRHQQQQQQQHGGATLASIVFPWLEHAGEQRMEGLLDEAKRKVRHWLKSAWRASDGVPAGLSNWRDAFSSSDWDSLVLKNVLPALGTYLRNAFDVNPAQQDLGPLEKVLAWQPLLRKSMMNGLLEKGFVPKWIDALYVWLTGEPNLEQVAEWYSWWKSWFADDVAALPAVSYGFKRGLDLMNQAMVLGDDAKYRLERPELVFPSASSRRHGHANGSATTSRAGTPKTKTTAGGRPAVSKAKGAVADEVSFRSIVEEMAANADLVVVPLGKVHEAGGQPLLRVSRGVDGKSGVTIYLDDDVVWVQERGGATGKMEYSPVSIEDMLRRAKGEMQ